MSFSTSGSGPVEQAVEQLRTPHGDQATTLSPKAREVVSAIADAVGAIVLPYGPGAIVSATASGHAHDQGISSLTLSVACWPAPAPTAADVDAALASEPGPGGPSTTEDNEGVKARLRALTPHRGEGDRNRCDCRR